MRIAAVLTLLITGCIEPAPAVVCGELICPEGSVCLASGTCASPDDVAACDGLADGAACRTPRFTGTCHGGACFAPVCGDGLVEGSEQCDGPVTDVDCVHFGFDLGAPTCNSCVVDLVGSCTRFGWRQLISGSVYAAWTDGSRLATARLDYSAIDIYTDGQLVASYEQPFYSAVTGNSKAIVASNGFGIVRWDGTAFDTIDVTALSGVSPTGNATINYIELGEDDVLYAWVATPTGCAIYARPTPGDWALIRGVMPANECEVMRAGEGELLLAVNNGSGAKILQWTGTVWTTLFFTAQPVSDLQIHHGVIYAAVPPQIIRWDAGSQTTITPVTRAGQIVPLDTGLYTDGNGTTTLQRIEGANLEQLQAPITGRLISDGKQVYVIGNGIYVYSGTEYSNRADPGDMHDLALLADGTAALAQNGAVAVPQAASAISWDLMVIGPDYIAVAGTSANDLYASDGTAIDHLFNRSRFVVGVPGGTTGIFDLWAPASGATKLYAVGADQLALAYDSSIWTSITPPAGTIGCALMGVTGDASQVIAAGTCGNEGVVWQLSGTAWTEIHRSTFPLVAVSLDPAGDIFAVGPSGGVREIAGTWTDDPGARGRSVAAIAPDDVWVAGGLQPVIHWDGTAWSRLAVIGNRNPRVVATPRAVTITGVSQSVLLR